MKPTEHREITGIEADGLPVGTVLMNVNDKTATVHDALRINHHEDGWGVAYGSASTDLAPAGRYLVLYVPAPAPPAVGDQLTLAQLKTLPARTVVVDPNGGAWQKANDGDVWLAAAARPITYPSSDLAGWNDGLILIWLPPESPVKTEET